MNHLVVAVLLATACSAHPRTERPQGATTQPTQSSNVQAASEPEPSSGAVLADAPLPTGPSPVKPDGPEPAKPEAAKPTMPAMRTFTFQGQERKVLLGTSPVRGSGFGCDQEVEAGDQVGSLAILAGFFQNACYTDGRYNARNFPVERGVVVGTDGSSFEAYRLSAATTPPQQFLGSHHVAFYRFPEARDYTIYALEQGAVTVRGTLAATQIVPGALTRLPVDASTLKQTTTYFVVPSAQRVSGLTTLAPQVAGSLLARGPLGEVSLYRYGVTGTPFDTATGFTRGPAENSYAYQRRLFPVKLAAGALGVVWQDTVTMAAQVTSIDHGRLAQQTSAVANPGREILAAAASDGDRNVFLFFVADGDGAATNQARSARLVRVNLATGALAEVAIDTSSSGLNITVFGTPDVASMAYAGGRLGLMIGRKMHRSSDGLNHQGGIAVVYDAVTLKELRNHGQTSGHSFENVLVAGVDGSFIGLDLGDNYPRGVHLHRFGKDSRDSALVYTFKTAHGTTPTSPAGAVYPAYPEISGSTQYYKWSNDNATYTELGGVVEDASGYTVVFAGEAVAGRALDNSRVGQILNDPRNIGVVRVRRDFDKVAGGSEISDQLVLTKGAPETGGFYAFGGRWTPQRNTGVVWLTQYMDRMKTNASRVRAVGLANGTILVLWESWTATDYVTTWGMKIDGMGRGLTPPVELGSSVRLGRRDDLWVDGNDVYIIAGRAPDHALDVIVVREIPAPAP